MSGPHSGVRVQFEIFGVFDVCRFDLLNYGCANLGVFGALCQDLESFAMGLVQLSALLRWAKSAIANR